MKSTISIAPKLAIAILLMSVMPKINRNSGISAELGVELPTVAKPLAAYVPAVRSGNLVFTSGQLPLAGQFTQQLATLLGAGQPLDRALGILLELPETGEAKKVLERVRETVRGGAPLSVALEQQHGLFSRLYVNLVRAGESGGGLDDAPRA